jgi:hypothetical protein
MSKYNNKTRGEPSKMAEMIKSAKQSAERDGVGLYQPVIDMVDDTLGYVPGNVHIICQLAYYIKHNPDYTSEEKEEVFPALSVPGAHRSTVRRGRPCELTEDRAYPMAHTVVVEGHPYRSFG